MKRRTMELGNMGTKESGAGSREVSKTCRRYETWLQPCMAELVGTMIIVFITCASSIENLSTTGQLHVSLVSGFIVAALVASLRTLR